MFEEGYFFNKLIEERKDSEGLVRCMKDAVHKLLSFDTDSKKPCILLGKIQGGKTRAFIGIIALAFDNGYDVAVVLTKGTTALTCQTMQRLESKFLNFIDEDKIRVFDIMKFPNNLVKYELNSKLVIVAKKEVNNMNKIIRNLIHLYPDLKDKKILIVDDEADYASISFRKNKEKGIVEAGKISSLIDNLRRNVASSDYLQITATPYSLYLQSDEEVENFKSTEFLPKKPHLTTLLPIYKGYIGGDYYFRESQDSSSTAFYVFEEVSPEEREALKKPDGRIFKIEDVLTSKRISVLRKAIMNFIVGGTIRRLQQKQRGQSVEKYSFIAHSEISTASHSWQKQIIEELNKELIRVSDSDIAMLNDLVKSSYNDLAQSVRIIDDKMPILEVVQQKVLEAIKEGYIRITVVNSKRETDDLLDRDGQLRLSTPLNIFIGGQILDRGVTINNLIGFYYGRNPKRFQQDTVLQHSRMYGNRKEWDLAVTRFYTTLDIYQVMNRIHDFDTALREAFLRGDHKNGVYFIRKDTTGKLSPCSPNKLMLSKITTLRPYKRMLPVGFQTDHKSNIKKILQRLDETIDAWFENKDRENPVLVSLSDIKKAIEMIDTTLEFENGYEWDKKAFEASIEHLSLNSDDKENRGKVWALVRKNRNLSRIKDGGGFSDAPDTPKTEGIIAKKTAINLPIVMFFRENGKKEQRWMGSPFWWPVLITPKNTRTAVFASETLD